nr:lipid II flippase MurJ [Paraoerskovia sediminicola]
MVAVMWSSGRFDDPGAYTVYFSTQAVYFLPYAILAIPLATSAFPRLAERASAGDRAGFAGLLALTTRGLLTVTAAGVAALVAASVAVESAFDTFADGSVDGMSEAIAWMAPGLVGFALIFHLSRALYSLDHGRAAVVATSAGWIVVGVVAVVLPMLVVPDDRGAAVPGVVDDAVRDPLLSSLGAANALGMTVAAVFLLLAVRRHGGPGAVAGVGRTTPVLLVGSALGAVAGYALTAALIPDGPSLLVAILVGLAGAVVAVLVVVGTSLALDRTALLAVLRPSAVADA